MSLPVDPCSLQRAERSQREVTTGPGRPPVDTLVFDPFTPLEAFERLRSVSFNWYVVAGWAIELFVGRTVRPHEDLEIAIPAGALRDAVECFSDLDFEVAGSGQLWPLEANALEQHFQTFGLDRVTRAVRVDLMRGPDTPTNWVYRRSPSVTLPLELAIRRSKDNVPYLAPGPTLLYKAKHDRDKDRVDLRAALEFMTTGECEWLTEHVIDLHPGHPWVEIISERR